MEFTDIKNLEERILNTMALLHTEEKRAESARLRIQTESPSFWSDTVKARDVSQRLSDLTKEIAEWDALLAECREAQELFAMARAEGDTAMQADIATSYTSLLERFEKMEFYVLLASEYDTHDAIVSIHSGAGGTDAQDWAEMLYRMLTRFCESKGWHVESIDYSRGGEAGLKNAMFRVHGRYAYGHLKSEHGVHRLVRISPFDAEQMRQTSFAMVEVIPDLGDVAAIDIPESDLRIDVFRSGGKGGQSVNTTDSAVRIVHIPSGITVVCQNEKSQHQNKASALSILQARLLKKRIDEQEAERKRLRGEQVSAEWGSQIRSYVLHPYKMVKDHRTGHEVSDPPRVLEGDIQDFVESYLRWSA